MTSISEFIIKTLCDHQGSLDFQRLNQIIALRFPGRESLLSRFLFDDDRLAVTAGRKKAARGQTVSPDSLVVAKTSLRICQKKNGECLQCGGLHLCRYYVCGDCGFGYKCKNPHSVASPYNAELLMRHGLQDLTEKQLFQLLLQNDPYLLPEICPHYNKGNGLHGSCKFGTDCTKLHVCQHYFQGDCKFGASCKRAHNIHAQGVKVFRGFSEENIQNLHGIYRNKLIIMNLRTVPAPVLPKMASPAQLPSHSAFQQHSHQSSRQPSHTSPGHPPTRSACPSKPSSDADKNEICLYFIRRHCRFTERCVHVHWTLPYRWQVLDRDGKTWRDLTNIEVIEKAYCDPGHDTDQPISEMFRLFGLQSSASSIAQAVNFTAMTYEGSPVRRLSTASSVSKPPHFMLTTQWLWYWKDDNGRWLEFGQGDSDTPASITSETLENVYLADRDGEIPFSAGKHQYILHFKGKPGTPQMYQENLKYKTKREVRRRPRFVSAHDVKAKVESASSPSSSISAAESFPSHWDKSALPDFGYKLVHLSESAADYKMIRKSFENTMPLSKIKSIRRIQNPSLWRVFQWQKDQMKVRNGGKDVDTLYLFHGTDESLIEAICEQNFDWRMCGVHGTAYGKGSYFARDASYSNKYANIKAGLNKIMFVALVLVGEHCKGRRDYVRPPTKGNSRFFYDSCVDNESNPGIYVIFEKQQIYPEYVIDYL